MSYQDLFNAFKKANAQLSGKAVQEKVNAL